MPDVISLQPADVRQFVSLDVHKVSIVAATLRPSGGQAGIHRLESTEKAIRRFIAKLGGPAGLAVCYEAGPGGFALWRLVTSMGVACDVVAPSLIPVRAGDRVKTDRRDAKKLVTLYRGGRLRFVQPLTPETRGSGICRAAAMTSVVRGPRPPPGRQAAAAPRARVREGKKAWTVKHQAWVRRQQLADPLAHEALV